MLFGLNNWISAYSDESHSTYMNSCPFGSGRNMQLQLSATAVLYVADTIIFTSGLQRSPLPIPCTLSKCNRIHPSPFCNAFVYLTGADSVRGDGNLQSRILCKAHTIVQ